VGEAEVVVLELAMGVVVGATVGVRHGLITAPVAVRSLCAA
jgi:hypothetical protein